MPAYRVYRDAVTGDYVTEEYASAHPDTTVSETTYTPPEGAQRDETDEPRTSAVTLDNVNPTLRPPQVI